MKAVSVLAALVAVATAQHSYGGSYGGGRGVGSSFGGASSVVSTVHGGGRGLGGSVILGGGGGGSGRYGGGSGRGAVIVRGGGSIAGIVHGGGSSSGGARLGGRGLYGVVDFRTRESEYHFSWIHDGGQKYDWESAMYYCSRLGPGWSGVSIETYEEDALISSIIDHAGVKYIWTSGHRKNYDFEWNSGLRFEGLNWSHTGGNGYPQPDNRENNNERCLAVLNNFYNDGIRWHDIGCHHEKPVICERYHGSRPYHG